MRDSDIKSFQAILGSCFGHFWVIFGSFFGYFRSFLGYFHDIINGIGLMFYPKFDFRQVATKI